MKKQIKTILLLMGTFIDPKYKLQKKRPSWFSMRFFGRI